jgi:hypothetical protein
MLKWWKISGSYAMALAAATTEERALELAQEHDREHGWNHGWCYAEELQSFDTIPPADPVAEGVYSTFAE